MFDHLHEHYVKITYSDLIENKATKIKEWDLDTPIQILCKQIEEGDKFTKVAGTTAQDK